MDITIMRLVVVAAAGVGFVVGAIGTAVNITRRRPPHLRIVAAYDPLPHHMPKHPGGVSFRFAMVHDVIHERYPKSGPAYYYERNRRIRERLAKLAPGDSAAYPLMDDLAVGLARVGKVDEAIALMRDKYAARAKLRLEGDHYYSTYANLGTLLIQANFERAATSDPDARKQFREGITWLDATRGVDAQTNDGREKWEASLAVFQLKVMHDPDLLKRVDFVGNRLDLDFEQMQYGDPDRDDDRFKYGRAYHYTYGLFGFNRSMSEMSPRNPSDPSVANYRQPIRQCITPVAEDDNLGKFVWQDRKLLPFDEPALGIVTLWRHGCGANPHFALALGEIMLRVGQRYIAWAAYERAARLADRFWPQPALCEFLREHCRRRQAQIEATLPAATDLRAQFDAELAIGEQYQRDYQEYEARQIGAGKDPTAGDFHDEFHATHEPIASPIGPEEWFARVSGTTDAKLVAQRGLAWGVVTAGFAAFVTAFLLWFFGGRRNHYR